MSLQDGPPNSQAHLETRTSEIHRAGVLELVDEADSKSVGLITRVGSSPTTGTISEDPQTLLFQAFAGFSAFSVPVTWARDGASFSLAGPPLQACAWRAIPPSVGPNRERIAFAEATFEL